MGEKKEIFVPYQPKGYGKIIAIIMTVLFFIIVPTFIAPMFWPKKSKWMKEYFIFG